jgi:hypothetical protein
MFSRAGDYFYHEPLLEPPEIQKPLLTVLKEEKEDC